MLTGKDAGFEEVDGASGVAGVVLASAILQLPRAA